jgi:O-antigen ligase
MKSNLLSVLFGLYAISLVSSMAGMELFGWTLVLLSIGFTLFSRPRKLPPFHPLIFIALALWAESLIRVAFPVVLDADVIEQIGNMRWALMLVGLYWGFQLAPPKTKTIQILFMGITVVSTLALIQHFLGIDPVRPKLVLHAIENSQMQRVSWRARGSFNSPMTFAYSACLSLGMCWGLWLEWSRKEKHKIIYTVILILSFAAVFSTYTRGAWLAALGGIAISLLIYNKKWLAGFTLVALLVGGTLFATSDLFHHRIARSFETQDKSNMGRFQVWRGNWEIFKDHPVIGVGYGLGKNLLPEYYPRLQIENGFIGHAHSNYLQMLSGVGALGFLLYLAFIIGFLLLTFRLYKMIPESCSFHKGLALASLTAQITLHIGGLTEVNFTDGEVNHYLIWILALTLWLSSQYTSRLEKVAQ